MQASSPGVVSPLGSVLQIQKTHQEKISPTLVRSNKEVIKKLNINHNHVESMNTNSSVKAVNFPDASQYE